MKNSARIRSSLLVATAVAVMFGWRGHAAAQTFASGSTGALGALAPSSNTTVALPPDGVLNYTSVTIPAGVTVTFQPNAANTPVTLLATGDVTIGGTVSVDGGPGANNTSSTVRAAGGLGGPGGFKGGDGGLISGPGAGPGQGPGGGAPNGGGGTYGAPASFTSLLPLFGGSGGAGTGHHGCCGNGGGGGGGGGAIVIASSTKISVSGTVSANGGACGGPNAAGGGSGGAVRLVAPEIAGAGSVRAVGANCGGGEGFGRIRLEAFAVNFSGSVNPPMNSGTTTSAAPGPVVAASSPALVALPTIAVSSVGGISAPATPGGSYSVADVSLPAGTANPVPVVVTATNTPVGATVTVALHPSTAARTTYTVGLSGSFSSSTGTASVTFPAGAVTVVQAWASMTLTGQVASLFPSIDGEPVERVMVAALDGGPSTLALVTKSGKERRLDALDPAERLKVALAWQALRERSSE
jgi:hypothetical protein